MYHPPPGSSRPSWVALVASLDQHCHKWHTIVDVQTSRQEQIGTAPSPAAGQTEDFSLLAHMGTCLQARVCAHAQSVNKAVSQHTKPAYCVPTVQCEHTYCAM